MLSVQSPSPLNMSPTHSQYYNNTWAPWRSASDIQNDLPTPPSSVPPRRTKQQHALHQLPLAQAHNSEHHSHLTLPPITQLDRRSSWSSPLTPPDDEMHSASLWRDSRPGPSRLHSPVHASPVHSPTPSPIDDEDDDYSYGVANEEQQDDDEMEEDEDEDGQLEVEVAEHERKAGVLYPESEWEWQQQQRQLQLASQQCPDPPQHIADWVISPQKRSAHFIAEKVCEMVCYFWFSSSLGPSAASSRHRRERERERAKRHAASNGGAHTSPNMSVGPLSNDRTAMLQFSASPEFVAFLQKLLETTQVSQSVIVLSLHYIYRLKERNDFTVGKQGSEFRVAVVALMLANKFVDDNTYTNKTWSEVSGISLNELNKMEREFLQGVDFRLYVDSSTYDSWLNLLRGLVLAKEREHQRWLSRRRVPSLALPNPHTQYDPSTQQVQARNDERRNRGSQPDVLAYAASASHRARSTSPHRSAYSYSAAYPFTFAVPYSSATAASASTAYSASAASSAQNEIPAYSYSQSARTSPSSSLSSASDSGLNSSMVVDSAAAEARSKRRAADAFSPTSASFGSLPPVHPPKRPTNLAVDIDAALSARAGTTGSSNAISAHPAYAPFAESLKSLERLSLASAGAGSAPVTPVEPERRQHGHHQQREQQREHTLAAPYRPEDIYRRAQPQNLYFYTLASSPVRPGPIASSSSSGSDAQTESTMEDLDVETEPSEHESERYYNAQGAERKARLKYSVAPTAPSTSTSAQHGYGYGHTYSSGNGYAYGSAAAPYHTSGYSRSTYPPPAPGTAAVTATGLSGAYSQSPQPHMYNTPEQQHIQSQSSRSAYSSSNSSGSSSSSSNNVAPHLPPLSSLALAQYVHPPPLVVQSARSSPLPSFRETYGSVLPTPTSASQPQAVTGVYAQSSGEGMYTPPNQHQHLQSQSQYYHPHHAYKPSVPSPLAQQTVSSGATSQRQHAAYTAAPAPFANAGPPGVVHFYQNQQPHAHSQTQTHAGYATPYSYARHADTAAPAAVSSGVAVPAPHPRQQSVTSMTMSSPLRALPYAQHQQSQSVHASPLACAYAARGRRY